MPYREYLRSKEWKDRKARILAKRKLICCYCGRKFKTIHEITFHHTAYNLNLHDVPDEEVILVHYKCHEKLSKKHEEIMLQRVSD